MKIRMPLQNSAHLETNIDILILTLMLEYWAGYSVNPLWLSVVGWRWCPKGFGNPWDGARATVGRGRGANRDRDAGILSSDLASNNIMCAALSKKPSKLEREN